MKTLVLARRGLPTVVALYSFACTGSIDTDAYSPETGSGGTAGAIDIESENTGGAVDEPAPGGPQAVPHLRRLTAREFSNSVFDLTGERISPDALEQDRDVDGLVAIGTSESSLSPGGVSKYEDALDHAISAAFADTTRAARVLACVPRTTADTTCVTTAIQRLGRRAFRRPLTDGEIARFVDIAVAIGKEPGASALVAMRYAVMAILQSPSFLYRVELGEPSDPDAGRLKYTSFELASRLAAFFGATVPDDELMDAAESQILLTPDGLRAQADRLQKHVSARRALSDFVDDLYGTDHLPLAIKNLTLFPKWTSTLHVAMREDLVRRVSDVVLDNPGDFLSLYDSPVAFVNNELALHYGLPAAANDSFRRVELPTALRRRGVISSGALLAANALPERTSPTQRGRFVVGVMLCQVIPEPDPDIDTTAVASNSGGSRRERLAVHRENPACASCHAAMDPIGLGLENFDSVGAYRTEERGLTIDASGDLDGVTFRDGAELATVLRAHPDAAGCFVQKMYTNLQGRELLEVDDPALDSLTRQFKDSGHRADELMVNIATSEAFRFVEPYKL